MMSFFGCFWTQMIKMLFNHSGIYIYIHVCLDYLSSELSEKDVLIHLHIQNFLSFEQLILKIENRSLDDALITFWAYVFLIQIPKGQLCLIFLRYIYFGECLYLYLIHWNILKWISLACNPVMDEWNQFFFLYSSRIPRILPLGVTIFLNIVQLNKYRLWSLFRCWIFIFIPLWGFEFSSHYTLSLIWIGTLEDANTPHEFNSQIFLTKALFLHLSVFVL